MTIKEAMQILVAFATAHGHTGCDNAAMIGEAARIVSNSAQGRQMLGTWTPIAPKHIEPNPVVTHAPAAAAVIERVIPQARVVHGTRY